MTVNGSVGIWGRNQAYFYTDHGSTLRGYVGQGLAAEPFAGREKLWGLVALGCEHGNIAFWTNGNADVDNSPQTVIAPNGTVGSNHQSQLPTGCRGQLRLCGLLASSDSSTSGIGVYGFSGYGTGVLGSSGGYAAYLQGNVYSIGTLTQNSDLRLKRDISNDHPLRREEAV